MITSFDWLVQIQNYFVLTWQPIHDLLAQLATKGPYALLSGVTSHQLWSYLEYYIQISWMTDPTTTLLTQR